MNLKFVINESVLIWYLLFHQSISKEMNVYKQKVWKNYCSEYKDLQKEKEIILRDPKNYIPDDDTIYDIMREFDGYDDIYRETEQYKMNIIKIWDEYKTKLNKELKNILRFDIDTYYVLLVNQKLNIIDLSSDVTNKIHTIVYGKKMEEADIQNILEIIFSVLKKEMVDYEKENQQIVEAVLELAILNELGTRMTGMSHYLVGGRNNKLLKRQIYPYFLMYLGIDRDDLTTYMRRDGIVFDATNYTNEIQLRKIDLKQFIRFWIKNQKNMIKVDNQEEIVVL